MATDAADKAGHEQRPGSNRRRLGGSIQLEYRSRKDSFTDTDLFQEELDIVHHVSKGETLKHHFLSLGGQPLPKI